MQHEAIDTSTSSVTRARSLFRRPRLFRRSSFVGRLLAVRLSWLGLIILLIVFVMALAAPLLTPYDPIEVDFNGTFLAPSTAHPLGTDELGRDVWSRIVFGTRISLMAGAMSVGVAVLAGVFIGIVGGYFGGWVDNVLMRVMDGLLAFPVLILALAIAAALGPDLRNTIIAIGVVSTPYFARLSRGQVLSIRERDYVMAARVLGAGDPRIMWKHIWPNSTGPIIVQGSLTIAFAIIAEASLSFLGVGVRPPTPSWGSMLKTGYPFMDRAPWLSISPGVAIVLAVMGFNFVGDALREVLDPRMRQRGI